MTESDAHPWIDYYGLLGIPDYTALTATETLIKRSYHVRAQAFAPDILGRDAPEDVRKRANDDLRLLNEAFAVLSDPVRRSRYDAEYNSRRTHGTPPSAASDGPSGHGIDKPQFAIAKGALDSKGAVVLEDIDPRDGEKTFRLFLEQIDGPPYDSAIHKFLITAGPPWDTPGILKARQLTYVPPIEWEFTLDPSSLEEGQEYDELVHIDIQVLV